MESIVCSEVLSFLPVPYVHSSILGWTDRGAWVICFTDRMPSVISSQPPLSWRKQWPGWTHSGSKTEWVGMVQPEFSLAFLDSAEELNIFWAVGKEWAWMGRLLLIQPSLRNSGYFVIQLEPFGNARASELREKQHKGVGKGPGRLSCVAFSLPCFRVDLGPWS